MAKVKHAKSASRSKKGGRKAPRSPASDHRINAVVRGLDGKSWIVKKREDGHKAWYRHSTGATSTSGRRVPPFPASTFPVGTAKRGGNGCLYIVRRVRKVPRWNMLTGGPKCGKWDWKATRKAPSQSAAGVRVGTVATGRNGRRWKVVEYANGRRSWRQLPKAGGLKGGREKLMSMKEAARIIRSYA